MKEEVEHLTEKGTDFSDWWELLCGSPLWFEITWMFQTFSVLLLVDCDKGRDPLTPEVRI